MFRLNLCVTLVSSCVGLQACVKSQVHCALLSISSSFLLNVAHILIIMCVLALFAYEAVREASQSGDRTAFIQCGRAATLTTHSLVLSVAAHISWPYVRAGTWIRFAHGRLSLLQQIVLVGVDAAPVRLLIPSVSDA